MINAKKQDYFLARFSNHKVWKEIDQEKNRIAKQAKRESEAQKESLKELKILCNLDVENHVKETHRATKTVLPVFASAHNAIRLSLPAYQNWHKNENASKVHEAIFASFLVLVFLILIIKLN